jgi:anion-transporting  ArsA/GET3 family ATPase
LPVFRGVKLLFIGGKGGVGKTTVAAATALRLARTDPRRRTLLLSTDPAHSLGDVFNTKPGAIGDRPARVPGAPANLMVRELDAERALAARREDLQQALNDIASSVGASTVHTQLMSLAPPGIDELFGILSVVDARDDYDLIVVDTAPTGHALRLLELPDTAREWVQVLLRVLLKYRSLVRPGRLAAELVDVQSIRELRTLLSDAPHASSSSRAPGGAAARNRTIARSTRRLKLSAGGRGECDDARARSMPGVAADAVAERRTLAARAGAVPRGRTGALSSRLRCPRRHREARKALERFAQH